MLVIIDDVVYVPAPVQPDDIGIDTSIGDLLIMLPEYDLNQVMTIKEYLKLLLKTLWIKREGFSGKRPFGNSGWEYFIYPALISAGRVQGELYEDGQIKSVDSDEADHIIESLIASL